MEWTNAYGYVVCLHVVRNVWNVCCHCLLILLSSVTNNYNFGYKWFKVGGANNSGGKTQLRLAISIWN